MNTYTTVQGDTWDMIAYRTMGSCDYVDQLMNANQQYIDIFIFSAGITLQIPEVQETAGEPAVPWR